MTYAKLERAAYRLRKRAEEEWKKLDAFYPAKNLKTTEDWVEFDGDDYFTQIEGTAQMFLLVSKISCLMQEKFLVW